MDENNNNWQSALLVPTPETLRHYVRWCSDTVFAEFDRYCGINAAKISAAVRKAIKDELEAQGWDEL